jgi:hypothetical protein
LIHESPSFFEIQCLNIRHYYPEAKVVVHVNEVLWNTKKKEIKKICLKYNVIINPKHLITNWATPSLFDAILDNINILNEQTDWTHYIFMSSNELFVSHLLENTCVSSVSDINLPVVWDCYSDVTTLKQNKRDRVSVAFDLGLNDFIKSTGMDIKTGLDFGRVISKCAFDKILPFLNKYWKGQNCTAKLYSQSEVVLPTVIEYLVIKNEISIIRNVYISTWITNYQLEPSNEFILVKKIPRDKHDPIVKKIMYDIGIVYNTNFYHKIKTVLKKKDFISAIFYKQRKIFSDFINLIYF